MQLRPLQILLEFGRRFYFNMKWGTLIWVLASMPLVFRPRVQDYLQTYSSQLQQ